MSRAEPPPACPRGWRASLRRSPLARRIVAYNLVALALLVAGVLYLDPFRDGLVIQRERALVVEAQLIAATLGARLEANPEGGAAEALRGVALPGDVDLEVFDAQGTLLAASTGAGHPRLAEPDLTPPPRAVISEAIDALRAAATAAPRPAALQPAATPPDAPLGRAAAMAVDALSRGVLTEVETGAEGAAFRVAAPVEREGRVVAALVATSAGGVIDQLAGAEREAVLRLFALAIALSIGLGLALASTIAGPLSDLAHAAEAGRGGSPAKVRIPDLSARRDEIGRLSGALKGLVAALLDRLDAEERFAADVAHEIKNPLASLGSAASALRSARRPEQRERLMGVIEHDLRRLDRLVSDISNASRLDGELVREAEAPFDLTRLLGGLAEHMGRGAGERGVTLAADLPGEPIVVRGLEPRLAQVFVNLIDNAVSFCEPGGAVRLWARRREGRVLVVVEDTGPGIPEAALGRVFERFYSERPEGQFGDNSGLGLAISKQIVEAHGGAIWAENIRAEAAREDPARGADGPHPPAPDEGPGGVGPPSGARIVVGLPA